MCYIDYIDLNVERNIIIDIEIKHQPLYKLNIYENGINNSTYKLR